MNKSLVERLDQCVIAGAVWTLLIILAAWWLIEGGPRGRLVNIEHAGPRSYEFLVDLNQADWPELAQLPKVGEVLARRIVASRKNDGPFHQPEDLLRVDGIGPRTLIQVEGYLLPLPGEGVIVRD